MATKVKRSGAQLVSDYARHGMNYLLRRDQISPLEKERNREKDWLKSYIMENGVKDASGNINVYFERGGSAHFVPGPGSTEYWGLQQRRSPGGEYMNTDEVKKFVADHLDPLDAGRVIYSRLEEVIDTEALYVLQQEGVITAKQLRGLIRHHDDTYQLWPITEPPMEED
jgi:hypothetical protein